MKKEKFSGPKGGSPKIGDKMSKKGFGPSEASKTKVSIKNHKQVDGPNEMQKPKTVGGSKHKAVSGPSAMKESPLGGKLKSKHMSESVGGDMHKHLGKHGSAGSLQKGFTGLEKVSDAGGPKYGEESLKPSKKKDVRG